MRMRVVKDDDDDDSGGARSLTANDIRWMTRATSPVTPRRRRRESRLIPRK